MIISKRAINMEGPIKMGKNREEVRKMRPYNIGTYFLAFWKIDIYIYFQDLRDLDQFLNCEFFISIDRDKKFSVNGKLNT